MTLRMYRAGDCEDLARLFYETVHTVCAGDYTREQLDAWAPESRDLDKWNDSFQSHCTLVAEENGRIIGFGDMDNRGYLDRLYVHRDFQGRGVATAICAALETRIPAPEYTVHASVTARPFFEKRGYTVVREQQVERRGVKLTNYVMRRKSVEGKNMRDFCDLHTHSVFSDGTWMPVELIRGAKALGLSAIALTDHNTVAGLPEFLAAGAELGVEAVPGVEFSVDYRETELHLLGLFIHPQFFDRVSELLEEGCRKKEQSNIDLVNALREAGYELDYESIRATTPKGQVNRSHIAAALTEKGYTASMGEAFRNLLDPERGYYRRPRRPDVFAMIRFIRSIGAVSVLAHPFLNLDAGALREFLGPAREAGLDGMETVYTSYNAETSAEAEQIATEFGLCRSGGSDFHGGSKPGVCLGTGMGELRVPARFYEVLRSRAESRR